MEATRAGLLAVLLIVAGVTCTSDRATAPDAATTPVAIAINGPLTMRVGQSVLLTAEGYNAAGKRVSIGAVTWSTSDTHVLTTSSAGVLAAAGPGTAQVRAQLGSLSATLTITVFLLPPGAVMAINPLGEFGDTIVLAPAQRFQLMGIAYVSAQERPIIQTPPLTWTSTRPDVATVDSYGAVTAVAEGVTKISASVGDISGSRTIRITPTSGTISVRFINVGDPSLDVHVRPNTGSPLQLGFGEIKQLTLPAGTLQVTADEAKTTYPNYTSSFLEAQRFVGFLPPTTRVTLMATVNAGYLGLTGLVTIAPLWEWGMPVAADSARVRVVLATAGGYNVYLVPKGASAGAPFLQGCYLDWPYGVTGYASVAAGSFDIELQEGKFLVGPIVAHLPVTPPPGHAVTYIITGLLTSTLEVITLVDQ